MIDVTMFKSCNKIENYICVWTVLNILFALIILKKWLPCNNWYDIEPSNLFHHTKQNAYKPVLASSGFLFFFINIALEVNFLLNWASIGVVIFVCFHAFISRCTLYLLNSFHSWFVNENLHILFYGLSKIIPVTCISLISRQWTFLTFFFQSKPLAIWNLYIYVWTKFVKWIDISKS